MRTLLAALLLVVLQALTSTCQTAPPFVGSRANTADNIIAITTPIPPKTEPFVIRPFTPLPFFSKSKPEGQEDPITFTPDTFVEVIVPFTPPPFDPPLPLREAPRSGGKEDRMFTPAPLNPEGLVGPTPNPANMPEPTRQKQPPNAATDDNETESGGQRGRLLDPTDGFPR